MALENIKCVITSGCSFSAWDNRHSWPYKLSDIMPHAEFKFLGLCSSGNELIQKKATLALHEALQEYKHNEILVLPMWSGLDRKTFYISNEAEVKRMADVWKGRNHWWHTQFGDLKNKVEQKVEMFVNGTEKVVYNLLGGWYLFHTDLADGTDIGKAFNKTNLDFTYGVHTGLENMIFLQVLCESKGVNIFHQFYMDSVLDSINKELGHQIVDYLYAQLDKNLIVCKSIHGFLEKQREEKNIHREEYFVSEQDVHPNPTGHKFYTEEVLWPFLKERLDNK
jgi:hypothetical protein